MGEEIELVSTVGMLIAINRTVIGVNAVCVRVFESV